MQSSLRYLSSLVAFSVVALIAGCGTTPETPFDTTQQVQRAEATLANFKNDPEMRWFRDNLKNAKAVVISPRVTRAGFVVGGSGGEALVLARDSGGQWAGPAFYNMGAGSVGLQIGVDVSEVVIVVMSEKALDALLSRSLRLGGDASIAAGPVGIGTASTVTADMVSFARSKGVYAGLNLEGAVISPDAGANSAFYGKPASPVDILVRKTVSNPAAAPLQQSLSQAVR
jgi:SH3 domain-containing YSC84-like protein 1